MNAIEKLTIKLAEMSLATETSERDVQDLRMLAIAARQAPQDAPAVASDVPSDDLVQWLADILCTEYSTGNWRTTARVAIRSIQHRLSAPTDVDAKDRDETYWRDGSARWKAEAEKAGAKIAELQAERFIMRQKIAELERAGAGGGDVLAAGLRRRLPQCVSDVCNASDGCSLDRGDFDALLRWSRNAPAPLPAMPAELLAVLPTYASFDEPTRATLTPAQALALRHLSGLLRTAPTAPSVPVSGGVRERAREVIQKLPSETYDWRFATVYGREAGNAVADALVIVRELAQ